MSIRKTLLITVLPFLLGSFVFGQHADEHKKFNASETIIHHVLDSHDWHLTDWPGEDGHSTSIAIHLPWFFYNSETGFEFYGSTHSLQESGKYVSYHEKPYMLKAGASIPADYHGHGDLDENLLNKDVTIIDLSPTKTVVHMFLMALLVFFIFRAVAKGYTKNKGKAPSGIQSFFEPIILFVRDDIAKDYLGDKAARFTPYLLSLFFFIWFSNVFGLMPFSSNIMGNIGVTAALATLTFIIVQVNGTKDYWQHIFAMPGVPVAILPLMTVIEIISLFVKPVALMIRLFANISAGHFMVLSLICLMFILGEAGHNVTGALSIMPLSIAFGIAIFSLEVIVAIIQAYIFTLLTAVFLGDAMTSHDDHH
ncbi:MAG: F0F1 ATP synthase subunit A [Bacteroidota bacterium]